MDYEKEYKAMVQRARELYESGNALTKLQMGIVCPELAESEDEKIRKALLRCCDDWEKGQFGCMAKEDVPAIRAYLERQKEQKPAEWSEEDERMYKAISIALTMPDAEGYLCEWHKTSEDADKWLKSLHERFNLQLKQEWREEDRRKINRIYDILGHAADDKGFLTSKRIIGDKEAIELQDFLKSLLPSWKPSEQEKGAIRTAIHILTGERTFPKAVAHLQNILNAFEGKESRKDWKPNEEQMEALDYVIGILGDMGEANTLRELDADLKKL